MPAPPDLLPALFDALPGFAGVLAPDGVVEEISRYALELTGQDGGAVRGVALVDAPWWSALPQAREQVAAALAAAAGGATVRLHTELGLPHGRVLPVELALVPLHAAGGAVSGLVLTAVEVAGRGDRPFERLVQGVSDYAIFRLDTEGRVASWNAGAERIKGYAAGEILGRSFACVFTEEDRAAGVPARVLAEAARVGRYESEGWRVRRDGTRFRAHAVVEAIAEADGTPVGFAKVTRDITAQTEQQRQRLQAQKLEAVGQLTGGIAHDFNNLLQAVSSNLELARAALAQGGGLRAERLIGNALRAIGRAGQLTQQLLAFSRRQILRAEHSRLSDIAAELPELLHRPDGEAVRVQTRAEPGLWSCRIDPVQFESALLSLVLNARDAMPQGGTATVSMANARLGPAEAEALELAPGDYVRIDVADTGVGMTPEVLARAFEPFFTTKDVGKGSGLGLSQVLGFTKQSGGSLAVESSPGRGTTVTLLFPRDIEPEPSPCLAALAGGDGAV